MAEDRVKNEKTPGSTENYRNPDGTFAEGNPGRPKGTRNFTTKVREALMKVAEGKDYTYEEAYLKAILKKAIVDQDTVIMKLLWNYLDGMPKQSQDIDLTSGGKPLYPDKEQAQTAAKAISEFLTTNDKDKKDNRKEDPDDTGNTSK